MPAKRYGIILSARTKKDKDTKRRIAMRTILLTIAAMAFIEVSISPIILCFAIASSDIGMFFHNLVVCTLVCGVTGFVSYVVTMMID